MPLITTALAHLIIVVIIGVVAGIAFNRVGLGWWSRTIGSSSQSDVTSALVGIAGAFIGFHLAVVVGLLPTPLMLYLGAILGAIVVLWFWRGR
jgi:uncharacterized membrane protein YeaQ/YmgE (transglycosylase-associated protein family)